MKPQTIESISHIHEAKIPYIVALNKMDMPTANPEKVKSDLAQYGVYADGYGGNVPVVGISAMKGTGIQDLLESLLLMAEDAGLSYDPEADIEAYVVETHQQKAGISVSCIIKNGLLKVGETIYAGDSEAKVKALITDTGARVNEVKPSMPFAVLGFKSTPSVGSMLSRTPQQQAVTAHVEKQDPFAQFFKKETDQKLNIILRAESQGSLEAIVPNLHKNDNIKVILSSVGDISESDVFLAKVSGAIIIGFATQASKAVEVVAQTEKVVIKTYNIIYNLLEDLQEVSELLKEKDERARTFKGEGKVRALFTIEGTKVVGVKLSKGKFDLHDRAEVYRDGAMKDEALIVSIKQRAATVTTLKKGDEGGIVLDPDIDVKEGDVVKSYSI